ncbi:MAG: hypothetical protein ACRKGH_04790 [Dehalogenimonas sp.]
MKTRLFSILAVTAVLASILSLGGVVYADSHADAEATAGGGSETSTYVYACHDAYAEAFAATEDDSSTGVDEGYTDTGITSSYAYAEATSKSNGYAHADVSVYVGNSPYEGEIYGYALANSSGSDSHAISNVDIHYVVPAGAWVDVDANGNAYAIALLLSDGSTVWGFAITDARNGDNAVANVNAGKGFSVYASVGEESES